MTHQSKYGRLVVETRLQSEVVYALYSTPSETTLYQKPQHATRQIMNHRQLETLALTSRDFTLS